MDWEVLRQLSEIESYEPLRNVLIDTVLTDMQTRDLARLLYVKRGLLSYGTGMGKTYMAAAYMSRVLKVNKNKKFIFIGKLLQKDETPTKIEKVSGLKVAFLDAKSKTFDDFLTSTEDFDVLFMTVNTLNDINLMEFIYGNRENIAGIVMDEVHTYCNYRESTNAQVLESMCGYFEYVLGLTATPINSSTDQLGSILRLINKDEYTDKTASMKAIRTMNYYNRCSIIVAQREQQLNQGVPIFITPMQHQVGLLKGSDILAVKGEGADNQLKKIRDCCLFHKSKGEQGLVFVRRLDLRPHVHDELNNHGIRTATIYREIAILPNGNKVSSSEVCEMFRRKELDVIITCKTEAIDLECEFVAFYELTMDVVQFVGRACRGVESKPVRVYFFITLGTFEVKFFFDKVYSRAEEVESVLGINRKETLVVGDLLMKKLRGEDIDSMLDWH